MAERRRISKSTFSATEVGTLIEDLRSQFKIFGEGFEDVRGRLAGVEAQVEESNRFATFHKLVFETLRHDTSALTVMGRKVTADIAAIRDEIHKNTTDLVEIKGGVKHFNSRLSAVEAKVGL